MNVWSSFQVFFFSLCALLFVREFIICDHIFIICDVYTDISNKEQLTINIRSVDKELEAHEDFFYNIRHIDGETNSVSYKRCGIKTTLSSLVKCRGQCYEGVSNMMGHKTSTKGLSYSLS